MLKSGWQDSNLRPPAPKILISSMYPVGIYISFRVFYNQNRLSYNKSFEFVVRMLYG